MPAILSTAIIINVIPNILMMSAPSRDAKKYIISPRTIMSGAFVETRLVKNPPRSDPASCSINIIVHLSQSSR